MLKPTHHYESIPKIKCTHIKIDFTVDEDAIKTVINSFLIEIDNGWGDVKSTKDITRKLIETKIKDNLRGYGLYGNDREVDKKNYTLNKDRVDQLARKLFPDWFVENSIRFINSLPEKK